MSSNLHLGRIARLAAAAIAALGFGSTLLILRMRGTRPTSPSATAPA
jgi:hypothetical protein